MKGRRVVTPQAKIINVNDKFGNKGIKKQQGTTRLIYDSLPIDGSTEFRFFDEVNSRTFPATNLGSSGNQLNVGEALVIERAYLTTVTLIPATGLHTIAPMTIAAFPDIALGELIIDITTQKVMKPIPVLSFFPEFNKSAYHQNYTNFEFNTQLVIPPLLEFVSVLRVAIQPAIADTDLRFTMGGVGAILAPKRTF